MFEPTFELRGRVDAGQLLEVGLHREPPLPVAQDRILVLFQLEVLRILAELALIVLLTMTQDVLVRQVRVRAVVLGLALLQDEGILGTKRLVLSEMRHLSQFVGSSEVLKRSRAVDSTG